MSPAPSSLTVYPNPAHAVAYVALGDVFAGQHAEVTVVDGEGCTVVRALTTAGLALDVSALPAGEYGVWVAAGPCVRVTRLVRG